MQIKIKLSRNWKLCEQILWIDISSFAPGFFLHKVFCILYAFEMVAFFFFARSNLYFMLFFITLSKEIAAIIKECCTFNSKKKNAV